MKRKFYRTILTLEILSEEPIGDCDLNSVVYNITEGPWSGGTAKFKETVLTGKQMAKALLAQGSDPDFFMLDEDGNDHED